MAATKTRTSSRPSKTTARKPARPKRKATAKRKSTSARQRGNSATNGTGRTESARQAVEGTAKQAGQTVSEAGRNVGRAARKAKTPLLAGGAAIAGAAGGLALGSHQSRKSKALRRPKVKMKIKSRDLAKAARDVGQFGMDVGQLASELRKNREEANGAKRRSPVEVVLEGLTHRGNSS